MITIACIAGRMVLVHENINDLALYFSKMSGELKCLPELLNILLCCYFCLCGGSTGSGGGCQHSVRGS